MPTATENANTTAAARKSKPKEKAPKSAAAATAAGDEKYARALDRLLKAARKARGLTIETRQQLADYALVALGTELGVKLPSRVAKVKAAAAAVKGKAGAEPASLEKPTTKAKTRPKGRGKGGGG